MKKLYVAGPMTGYENLNFSGFHAVTKKLRDRGYEVINPAEVNTDQSANWLDCMRADLALLAYCDGIVMLQGWERSEGAKIEHDMMRGLKLPIFYAHKHDEIPVIA